MTAGIRNQSAVWRIAAVAIVAMLVTGIVAAQARVEGRRAPGTLSTAEALEHLGPAPLLPRPAVDKRVNQAKAATLEEGIDRCVERNMTRLNAPGAAVAVILDGELLYESGYGVKRQGGSILVNADTIFRIGSVTKMMTAAAVMQQVELGRVDLDAPVTDYIPEFEIGGRWPADRITVWHTLTHTTGIPDLVNDLTSVGDEALSNWAQNQDGMELHAPPGSFWNYSNPNFMLAGLVAERASETRYRELYRESLWVPAGMHSTTFNPSEVLQWGNFATGYYYDSAADEEYFIAPRDFDLWAFGPAGVAFSTVGDLTRWALLLMDGGGPVLSPWSAATMQGPHQWMHYTPDLFYGFGIMLEEYQGLDVRQHGGNVIGFGTYLLWVPERRFAVALLTNVTSSLNEAAYCIVDEVLDPIPVDPPDLFTDPLTWKRYVGDYVMTDFEGMTTDATIHLEGNRLMVTIVDPAVPGSSTTWRLYQAFLDTFVYDSDGDRTTETDFTFCSTRGKPGILKWIRNRQAVGERQVPPRTPGSRGP